MGSFLQLTPSPKLSLGEERDAAQKGASWRKKEKKNNKNNVFNSVMTFGENESLDDWYKSKEETVREIHCVMIGQRVLIWGEGRF